MRTTVFGLPINFEIPDNCVPLEAFVIVKIIDEDGHERLFWANTEDMAPWEKVGIVTMVGDDLRHSLLGNIEDGDA